jgi:hypothetical protein
LLLASFILSSKSTRQFVNDAVRTDVVLRHTPLTVAAAALRLIAAREGGQVGFNHALAFVARLSCLCYQTNTHSLSLSFFVPYLTRRRTPRPPPFCRRRRHRCACRVAAASVAPTSTTLSPPSLSRFNATRRNATKRN